MRFRYLAIAISSLLLFLSLVAIPALVNKESSQSRLSGPDHIYLLRAGEKSFAISFADNWTVNQRSETSLVVRGIDNCPAFEMQARETKSGSENNLLDQIGKQLRRMNSGVRPSSIGRTDIMVRDGAIERTHTILGNNDDAIMQSGAVNLDNSLIIWTLKSINDCPISEQKRQSIQNSIDNIKLINGYPAEKRQ